MQETTIGESNGHPTPRERPLAAALQEAGFPTAISSNMNAWLKTHVALVSPIADAFYTAGADLRVLADSRSQVIALLGYIRKAFAAWRAQGIPTTQATLRGVEVLPVWMLMGPRRRAPRMPHAKLIIARHASVACEEMTILAAQLQALVARGAGLAANPTAPESGRP